MRISEKRLIILALAVIMVIVFFTKCAKPPAVRDKLLEGFVYYENPDWDFRLQYPEEWYLQEYSETDAVVSIYDIGSAKGDLTPHLFVNVIRMRDIPFVKRLDLHPSYVQYQLEAMITSSDREYYENYSIREKMRSEVLGYSYYLVYEFDATFEGEEITYYSALMACDNYLLRLTFGTFSDVYEDSVPLYEKILSTVMFYYQ